MATFKGSLLEQNLNPEYKYSIIFKAQPAPPPPSLQQHMMEIKAVVIQRFYALDSRTSKRNFTETVVEPKTFHYPHHLLTTSDDDHDNNNSIISEMLSSMEIPFPLDRIKWGFSEIPLESTDDLIKHFRDLIRRMLEFSNGDIRRLFLIIEREVFLPNKEFEGVKARAKERDIYCIRSGVSALIQKTYCTASTFARLESSIYKFVERMSSAKDDDYSFLIPSLINEARRELRKDWSSML